VTDNKNFLLFLVLSALLLFGWSWGSQRFFPTPNAGTAKVTSSGKVAQPAPRPEQGITPPLQAKNAGIVIAQTPRVAIATPRLAGSINLAGARIDDLVLVQQRQSVDPRSAPVRLLSPGGAPNAYFAGFGWTGNGVAVPGPDTVWTPSGARLTPASPVTLLWNNGQGLLFRIAFKVDENYLFTVEQSVANGTAAPVAVRPYALVSRIGATKDPSGWTNHIGPVGVFNGTANYNVDFKTLVDKGDQRFATSGGWIGFSDKYWLTALVPDQHGSVEASFRHGANDSYQADFTPPPAIVPPGGQSAYRSHVFAGAKEVKLLDAYTGALGTELERAIDWGWFRWFMQPIFSLLNWLYAAIGNFGLAIICLTIIMRALLFPVAQKQFKSMAAMRVLQPKMKELQERYKDDKETLQRETLKLYQQEKANPLAGCLPIFLQFPIFYALYKVLMLSVEMRHKPFVLWLKDLSAPDPLTPVNLFGLLPFTPPPMLAVGILPIVLGVTMFVQQKLNPPPADPVQRQVFGLMPWLMMFFFAPLAAGLQLYYVCNGLLSIAQQQWMNSRYPGLRDPAHAGAK
jgi:YidC/Oxa1 family membrane protein insertase